MCPEMSTDGYASNQWFYSHSVMMNDAHHDEIIIMMKRVYLIHYYIIIMSSCIFRNLGPNVFSSQVPVMHPLEHGMTVYRMTEMKWVKMIRSLACSILNYAMDGLISDASNLFLIDADSRARRTCKLSIFANTCYIIYVCVLWISQ